MYPLAFFITWTTYGAWLPGDARGWIKSGDYGVKPPDPELKHHARKAMAERAVVLTPAQRALVEQTITAHCRIRGWILHAVNVRTNHIHAVVSANRDPNDVRDQFKAWCSRKLSDHAGLTKSIAKKAGRRHWFTEGGDIQVIETDEHLENAVRYVVELQ
jgi:REP element-mobilizing transposase RayT